MPARWSKKILIMKGWLMLKVWEEDVLGTALSLQSASGQQGCIYCLFFVVIVSVHYACYKRWKIVIRSCMFHLSWQFNYFPIMPTVAINTISIKNVRSHHTLSEVSQCILLNYKTNIHNGNFGTN